MRIAVIGAGLAGLAAAARLAGQGHEVDVFEQNQGPGGKAGTLSAGGYRFDTGPSLLTMPQVFDELFHACGRRRPEYLEFQPLDELCRYTFADGTRLSAYRDVETFATELESRLGEASGALERYLRYCGRLQNLAGELFLENSLHDLQSYLKPRVLTSLMQLWRLDAMRNMDAAVRSFFRDRRTVQLFDRYATYNGSSPYRVPATLNIIPAVEYLGGAYAVTGGIHAIPCALEQLGREMGVRFHYRTPVHEILYGSGTAPGAVRGVCSALGEHESDVVISNLDVIGTYRDLLHDTEAPLYKRYMKLEPSSSGMVFLWGMRRSFPELTHHNIFFSRDYPAEFHSLFEELQTPADPSIYINITSKSTTSDAPDGCENWFVLINAPRDCGQDWTTEREQARTAIIQRLNRALGISLEPEIEFEGGFNPPDIERMTGSAYGSLYGISSNTKLAAFLRHPNRSRRYPGLFFCGGSAHPGGGMPLAVLSGKITADLVGPAG